MSNLKNGNSSSNNNKNYTNEQNYLPKNHQPLDCAFFNR